MEEITLSKFTAVVKDKISEFHRGRNGGRQYYFYTIRVLSKEDNYLDIKVRQDQFELFEIGKWYEFNLHYKCAKLWECKDGKLRPLSNFVLDSYDIADMSIQEELAINGGEDDNGNGNPNPPVPNLPPEMVEILMKYAQGMNNSKSNTNN